ncbi:GDSL-type esterase/lipase family protein [Leptolyngbya sp. BC1307]|uniref:GDSL-type esterase/lipase family protein n=1 Tax=Leptolyngbya sp. BC1307 TaxID=2029589 RepID=UPI001F0B0DB9|nr:GDSL-type esterase/lipase family protein [Leptolyngbya sp. BC1307]
MVKWFIKIPSWAALSLMMNGLLFGSLLSVWQEQTAPAERLVSEPLVNASVTDAAITDMVMELPRPAGGRKLSYQQWIDVLAQEARSMVAKRPEHLTVLLGDSLSLWFPGELMPGRRVWINQSISGEKTQGVLDRLDLLKDNDVEAIFVMIGINDLIWGKTDEEIVANYQKIVLRLKEDHPKAQIVVQSILPHGGENSTWESRDKLLALQGDRIVALNDTLKTIAAENNAYYLDLYPIFVTGDGNLRDDLTTDGLHLNRQGYLVWRSAIALYAQLELQ